GHRRRQDRVPARGRRSAGTPDWRATGARIRSGRSVPVRRARHSHPVIARVRAVAVVLAALLPAACAAPLEPHCPAGTQDMAASTMYFGMRTPTSLVSATAWQRFVDEVVTPRFEA